MIAFLLIICSIYFGLSAELLPGTDQYDTMYGYYRIISYTSIACAAFFLTPYSSIITKTLTFSFALWSVINLIIQFTIPEFIWNNDNISKHGFIIVLISYIFILFKSYTLPKDQYSETGVYIAFKKPGNIIEFFIGFFCRPVSSVSVIIDGHQYRYKKGEKYHINHYTPKGKHVYIKTGFDSIRAAKCLSPLIGNQWHLYDNCCHAVLRLYNYKKRTRLHRFIRAVMYAFPSVLIIKIMKGKNHE